MITAAETRSGAVHRFLTQACTAMVASPDLAVDRTPVHPFNNELHAGIAALECALKQADTAREQAVESSDVPVLGSVDALGAAPLAGEFRALDGLLPWVPSFRGTDKGTEIALCTLTDVLPLEGLRCGFVYVGARRIYPEHQHRPQEMYLTVAGQGNWLHGARDSYELLGPSRLVYNPPDSLHGIRADDGPVLALYVLWGEH